MTHQLFTSTPVTVCDQLISLNNWAFLAHDTAGWSTNSICSKSSRKENYWAEWTVIKKDDEIKYQLHVYDYDQDPSSRKIETTVDCFADILKHCIRGDPRCL